MKIILIALFCWLTASICFGQEATKKNALSLSFGTSYIMRQDLIFSPALHTDLAFPSFGLEYKREAKLFQKVGFRYTNFNPMIAEPYEFTVNGDTEIAHPHSFNLIKLDYLIGKKILENQKSIITVGGLFSTDVHALNYVYGRISSLGYYAAFGIGAFGTFERPISEKGNLAATLQMPLLAWLARSPYLVNDDEFIKNISSHAGFKTFLDFIGDGQVVTWHKMQTLALEMKYEYSLRRKWELGLAYQFEFIHVSQPRDLLSFCHFLNLSTMFSF